MLTDSDAAALPALHAEAVGLTVDAVRHVTRAHLELPTPCDGWDLATLLDHMTVQNRGFAAAADGDGADERVWTTGAYRADPVADHQASSDLVVRALAAPGVTDRALCLPELSREQTFTAAQATTMHTIDSLLHAWDVASALGAGIDPSAELVTLATRIGEQIPDTGRDAPGAPFGPRREPPAGATALERVLALYGRAPR
ncbi:TIGR03086 family protein [Pseudonocardia ammonioxydans]|uniref:TIGR03086 family protein n=1 Tax=Pseudonocardia ammonioxydans TaxID=260086 RepID=A0A1I5FA81_PSUAM|nr:TIGR03086 family metal-binding protein [Pseudonocardia ammonioxydans]SFO20665.1 TIGR03086 family protein [Pseudonocardia ammonioxydans]